MDIGEFIDTYSDDLIYIHEARTALRTHPLRSDYAFAKPLDASFGRMLAVFVIGNIEAMLKVWRERDEVNVLDKYFADRVSNGDRVLSLYQAFRDAGIRVDKEVFDDYLAIKYLRNTIIHGEWKEKEKEWLENRGFPSDSRQLTKAHLDRIDHANQNMMMYIFLTSTVGGRKPEGLVRLDERVTQNKDDSGILRAHDIDRIIWNNLERIDSEIYSDIEKTAVTAQYDWTERRSVDELERLGHSDRKRLFYLAARRAGEENFELLARHRALAMEAFEFWRDYRQRALASRGVTDERIRRSLEILDSPQFKPEVPVWSSILDAEDDVASQLVKKFLDGDEPFTSEDLVDSLRVGRLVYELVPNIMPVTLFTLRLPIVDVDNTSVYLAEAESSLELFRLNRVWYSTIEDHGRFTGDILAFYSEMSLEFAKRSQTN